MPSQLSLVPPPAPRRPAAPALVVVAHGSRDPRALSTVSALLDRVRALRPDVPVHLGHIELNAPLLPDTLAALGDTEAVLVPLLLSRGYHVKQDIPEMAAASRARTQLAGPPGPPPQRGVGRQAPRVGGGGGGTPSAPTPSWSTPSRPACWRPAGAEPPTAPARSSSPRRAPVTRTRRRTPPARPTSWPPAWASPSSRPTPPRRPRRSKQPSAPSWQGAAATSPSPPTSRPRAASPRSAPSRPPG